MRDVPFHPQISPLSEHCSLVGPPSVLRQNQGWEGTFCGTHLEYAFDYWLFDEWKRPPLLSPRKDSCRLRLIYAHHIDLRLKHLFPANLQQLCQHLPSLSRPSKQWFLRLAYRSPNFGLWQILQDLVADKGLAVAKESVTEIDLRSLSSSLGNWRGFDGDHMVVIWQHLVTYTHDISMLSFTSGACQKQRHTMNFSVTAEIFCRK